MAGKKVALMILLSINSSMTNYDQDEALIMAADDENMDDSDDEEMADDDLSDDMDADNDSDESTDDM